ncbi:hypothetical protein U0070_016227 [Myodes glareolus]|uniref:Uncharacterized protein n=1 Tax=Myodes glareolus TaxID=447135 RepID=A0AAW0JF65_MYOGA
MELGMGYIFRIGQLEGSFAGWLALSTSWSAVCCCDLRLSDEIRTTGGEKYWDLASNSRSYELMMRGACVMIGTLFAAMIGARMQE